MKSPKPCPFCGSEEIDEWTAPRKVECQNCFASAHPIAWGRRVEPAPYDSTEQAVITAAMELADTARRMGVLADLSLNGKYDEAIDLREYAAKETAVFTACAALAKECKGEK